ncbi:hypothetical protein HZA57_05735, partial [Candidatus Poribacteria bacterium]|nr:hypothetical protein [Candidatus Poribacteria bacterium]
MSAPQPVMARPYRRHGVLAKDVLHYSVGAIGFACLSVGYIVLVRIWHAFDGTGTTPFDPLEGPQMIRRLLPVLVYSLGLAATAEEGDGDLWTFTGRLPVHPVRVALGKLAACLLLATVWLPIAGMLTRAAAGGTDSVPEFFGEAVGYSLPSAAAYLCACLALLMAGLAAGTWIPRNVTIAAIAG